MVPPPTVVQYHTVLCSTTVQYVRIVDYRVSFLKELPLKRTRPLCTFSTVQCQLRGHGYLLLSSLLYRSLLYCEVVYCTTVVRDVLSADTTTVGYSV